MKRVLLLATTTGYQIRSFGDAARAVGATLMLGTDRCDQLDDPWADHAVAVRFIEEPQSLRQSVSACLAEHPDAVLAVGDRPTLLAAHVNAALQLPGNPPTAATRSRNKLQTREALQRAGLPSPEFQVFSLRDDPAALATRAGYPAVLKPLALSGSRGVIRVNDAAEFVAAFERLRELMASPEIRLERDAAHDAALVERFVPGAEFAVEGVLTRGAFQLLAIFDKPDPLDGPFFEETIYVTPSRQPAAVQQRIVDAVAAAAAALGLRHGPVHAECRVNQTGVYVLEVAARPIGGLCARCLRFDRPGLVPAQVSLEEVLLRHAIGQNVTGYRRERRASAVMMIPIPGRGILRAVRGMEEARAVPGVDGLQITAQQDALLIPLPEGHRYLGFIFASGEDAAAAERALRDAHARMEFVIDREVPLVAAP
jgi:formate-dependent phosphoribosylglycinamide formyltransferase (GAR transformylase)